MDGNKSEEELVNGPDNVPLLFETVWLRQKDFEDAEAAFQMRTAGPITSEDENVTDNEVFGYPDALMGETVWFSQTLYEKLEADYQMKVAGVHSGKKHQVKKKKSPGAAPVNHKQKLENVISDLQDKQSTLNEYFEELKECRQTKIKQMHTSMIQLSAAVHQSVKRMGTQIEECGDHMESIQDLLDSVQSTVKLVQEKNKTQLQGPHTYKSLHASLNDVNNGLMLWYDDIFKMKMGTLDVSELIENINRLKFVENVEPLQPYKKKYPKFKKALLGLVDKLTDKADREVNGKNEAAKYNTQAGAKYMMKKKASKKSMKSNGAVKERDVSSESESMDGSLGVECFSDKLNSDLDEIDDVVGQSSDAYGKMDSNKKNVKAKPQQASKNVSKSNNPKVSQAKSPQNNSQPKGSKAKSDKGDNKMSSPSPSKTPVQASGKTAAKAKRKLGEQAQSRGTANPNPKTSPQTQKLNDSSGQVFVNYSYYRCQLNEMSQKVKSMLFVNGPTLPLQNMLTEIEILIQSMYHDPKPDQFRHRFALLEMAFSHHKKQESKVDKAARAPIAREPNPLNTASAIITQRTNVTPGDPRKKDVGKKEKPKNQDPSEHESVTVTKEKAVAANALPKMKKIYPKCSSIISKIATLDPRSCKDRHRAGISSIVVLDQLEFLVLVDIINSCLKLYDTSEIGEGGGATLVTSLEIDQPYYMTAFGDRQIVVSRGEHLLSVIQVSDSGGLLVQQNIKCGCQYYGLGWVGFNIIACAFYEGSKVHLMGLHKGYLQHKATFSSDGHGPELLSVIPSRGNIVYLERVPQQSMHLTCINTQGVKLFSVSLGGEHSDVWNLACVESKIVCCNKGSDSIVLFSESGRKLRSFVMPKGGVKMPFAIGFSQYGPMFLANDAEWEEDNNHYVTTEINVFSFG